MSNVILMPQTGSIATGASFFVGTSASGATLQFTPQQNVGFSGTVLIESSTAPNPGANDWFTAITLVFSAHTTSAVINAFLSNNPWLRARVTAASIGAISVYMAAS